MALVLEPFTLRFQMEDSNGDTGALSFYAPETTPTSDLADVIAPISALLAPITQGQIYQAGFSSTYKEDAYVLPTPANGNAHDVAVLTFVTTKRKNVTMRIPTFDPTLTLDAATVAFKYVGRLIDISDAGVAAFVAGMISGFTDGAVTVQPSGRRAEDGDVVALKDARFETSASRTQGLTAS